MVIIYIKTTDARTLTHSELNQSFGIQLFL